MKKRYMNNYYILGFVIKDYNLPSRVYKYSVPDSEIQFLRAKLIKNGIPHIVKKDPIKEQLNIYSTSPIDHYCVKPLKVSINEIKDSYARLLTSAIRILFISKNWKRSMGKLFNPNDIVWKEPESIFNIYRGIKIHVDKLGEKIVLFLDTTRKIEFVKNLKDLESDFPDLINKISFVKLLNSSWSFNVIKRTAVNFIKKFGIYTTDLHEYLQKLISIFNELSVYLYDSNSNFELEDLYVLQPNSLRLIRTLKGRGLLFRNQWGNYIILLPKTLITPVATLENVSLFNEIPPLRLSPQDRYREVKDIFDSYGLKNVKVDKIEIKLSTEIVKINKSYISSFWISSNNNTEISNIKEMYNLACRWKIDKNILSQTQWNFIIITYRDKRISSEWYHRLFRRTINIAKQFFESIIDEEIEIRKVEEINRKQISKILNEAKKENKKNVAIMVALVNKEDDKRIRTVFEYLAAENQYYPHYISLINIINEIVKNKEQIELENLLSFRLRTILKSIITRAGFQSVRIKYPDPLKDYVIAGIDATRISLKDYTISIGVVTVLVDNEGSTKYIFKNYPLERGDLSAIVSGLQDILYEYDFKVIAYINKANLFAVLDKLIRDNESLNGSIIIGATKTHSYSRILKYDRGLFVNPPMGIYTKINTRSYKNKIINSKYLVISTMYHSKKRFEGGTLVPLLLNISREQELNINERLLLDFTLSLCCYNNLSSLWIQSLPWPLHRADRLSKKIYRISSYVKPRMIPNNSILRYL